MKFILLMGIELSSTQGVIPPLTIEPPSADKAHPISKLSSGKPYSRFKKKVFHCMHAFYGVIRVRKVQSCGMYCRVARRSSPEQFQPPFAGLKGK
jgi:hypothetical protein